MFGTTDQTDAGARSKIAGSNRPGKRNINSRSEIYQFFASKQGETGSGDTHIHLVVMGTDRYEDFLTLRDYLLENKKEAEDYMNHKKKLIELGVTDRKQYRATKSEYVSALIERARENKKKNK